MDSCQSGFHDSRLQFHLQKVVLRRDLSVNLCDFCFRKIMDAKRKQEDLTMEILYTWGIESDGNLHLPAELKRNGLKTAKLVEFVNNELGKMRNRNQYFPTLLLNATEKDDFSRILVEDNNTVKMSLENLSSDAERKSIYLRVWSGCLDASKMLHEKYVAETNVDGSTKREQLITAKMREDAFAKIATKFYDHIYEAGVNATVLWQLKVIGQLGQRIYLDGVPIDSVIWHYIKDKNKKIISENDLEPTKETKE
jgi:hypothetical protein